MFNHLQTKSLLENGYVNGRGLALAMGTAYDSRLGNDTIIGGGTPIGFTRTGSATTPTPDYTAATTAVNNFTQAVDQGTGAVGDNTGSTEDNTKSKKKEKTLAEKLGDLYDWVAVRLEYFGNKTKSIADKINDYISLTSKTALLSKQMDAVAKEINANATGARTYREQADLVATQMEMSNDLVRKARTGKWQFEELSDDDEDKVKTYLKYYDGFQKATEKVRELRNEQLKLFEDWANMPTEKAEKKVEKLTNRIETLSGAYSVVSSGASGLGVYNQVMNADYYSASKAVKSASKKANSADMAYQSASARAENAENEARSFGNMLQGKASSKKGVPQSVKNKISAAVSSGTVVRLTSKERKSTPASLLKQIDKYNKQVNNGDDLSNQATSAKNARNNANAVLKEAKGNLSDVKSSMTNVQKTALQYSKDNTYVGQNALLDAQVKDQKNVVKAYDTAFKTATENVSKTANKATKAKAKADAAEKKLYDAGQSILSGDVAKNLSSKQKKAIKAGKTVDTRGLTGDTLKAVKEYNKQVTASQRAQENAADATTNYNTALKAQEVASQNLVNAKTEEAQMIIENEKQKFENIKTYYEAELNYQNALTESYAKDREFKEKQGKDTTVADYTKEINSIQKEQAALQNEKTKLEQQLQESVSKGRIKEGSEEWKNMKAQIIGIDTTIDDMSIKVLDLQDEMRNEVFYRALNKALKEAEKLRDAISTIGSLVSDEMMFDKDGNITNLGITSLAMNLQGFSSNLGTLETLLQKRQMIIDKYNGGKNDTNYSQKEFDEDMETITGEIQNALKNADSARNTIIGIIAKISKAELDATFKVIDARKKLLNTQKE